YLAAHRVALAVAREREDAGIDGELLHPDHDEPERAVGGHVRILLVADSVGGGVRSCLGRVGEVVTLHPDAGQVGVRSVPGGDPVVAVEAGDAGPAVGLPDGDRGDAEVDAAASAGVAANGVAVRVIAPHADKV